MRSGGREEREGKEGERSCCGPRLIAGSWGCGSEWGRIRCPEKLEGKGVRGEKAKRGSGGGGRREEREGETRVGKEEAEGDRGNCREEKEERGGG